MFAKYIMLSFSKWQGGLESRFVLNCVQLIFTGVEATVILTAVSSFPQAMDN